MSSRPLRCLRRPVFVCFCAARPTATSFRPLRFGGRLFCCGLPGYVVLGYVVLVLSGCLVLVSGYVMLVVPVDWFCLVVWCCGGGVVFLHC